MDEQYLQHLPLAIDTYLPATRKDMLEALEGYFAVKWVQPIPYQPTLNTGVEPLPPGVPKLLGFIGLSRSGKDSLSDYLLQRYGNMARFAYSDIIIEEVNGYLRQYNRLINQMNKSEPHARRLLQSWGSARRAEQPDYWLDKIQARLSEEDGKTTVITGLRLPLDPDTGIVNTLDVDLVHELGGEVWRIHRLGDKRDAHAHPNDQGVNLVDDSLFDFHLYNTEDNIEDMFAQADERLRTYSPAG